MDDASRGAKPPKVRFIRDEPAEIDFFQSHDRLAATLATVVEEQPELRIIGLLGDWGSGKSTVVKLMRKRLEDPARALHIHCFEYDTWLHQSDPPRRAFLEALIYFLISKNLTTLEEWSDRLDELNGRIENKEIRKTPTLTTSGRLLLPFLLLWPVGLTLTGWEVIKDAFDPNHTIWDMAEVNSAVPLLVFRIGIAMLAAPVFIAALFYVCWRPWKGLLSGNFVEQIRGPFWQKHRKPHDNDSILSLFLNRAVERTQSKTIRNPDPTAIEFQDFFRDIMDSVSGGDRRFVFIIDNLDRLPSGVALTMWGTIRSFFLGAVETIHVRRATHTPTVVLPIDERGVREMYGGDQNAESTQLSQSLMEKAFDITFRVTPPVISGWHDYLSQQMIKVLGSIATPERIDQTVRMYGRAKTDAAKITPRTINTLVNEIAALWLLCYQWDLAWPSVVYFSIHRASIDENIVSGVKTPVGEIASLDPDWQKSIAALHFGVEPNLAIQMVLEQPIRTAIETGNFDELKAMAAFKGFGRVFRDVIDLPPLAQGSSELRDPIFLCSAAVLFHDIDLPDEAWIDDAWRRLCNAFDFAAPFSAPADIVPLAIEAFGSSTSGGRRATVLEAFGGKLAAIPPAEVQGPNTSTLYVASLKALAAGMRKANLPVPSLQIPGDAQTFLIIAPMLADDVDLVRALKTRATDVDIVRALAGQLETELVAGAVPRRLDTLIVRGVEMQWDAFIASAGNIIQSQSADYPGTAAAMYCLGTLRKIVPAAKEKSKELADSGQFVRLLSDALSHSLAEIQANSVALHLLSGNSIDQPNGQSWETILSQHPELAAQTEQALRNFEGPNTTDALVDLASTNAEIRPLVRAILSLRIGTKDLGALPVATVIKNLGKYLECFDKSNRSAFIIDLSEHETFWGELNKTPLEGTTISILQTLLGAPNKSHAVTTVQGRLDTLTIEQWQSVVRAGAEPLGLAGTLKSAEPTIQIGSNLAEALNSLVGDMVANSVPALRANWFKAVDLLSSAARGVALKRVRDWISAGHSIGDPVALLNAAGGMLMKEGGFAEQGDNSVRNLAIPLLSTAGGLDWLEANASEVCSWIQTANTETKSYVGERIGDLIRSANDEQGERLKMLAATFGLELAPREKDNGNRTSET